MADTVVAGCFAARTPYVLRGYTSGPREAVAPGMLLGMTPERDVVLRSVRWADWPWLTAQGLSFSKVGSQYHWLEAPLQLYIAPMRATLGPRGPAAVVEVDGRRAGYIGRNPLSGNLEYFLQPWARGGSGRAVIAGFLRDHRPHDRERAFFVAHKNERSLRALLGALATLGWHEGDEYSLDDARLGTYVRVRATP